MRVAVVGGGAVGLAAARHLADSGAEVVLYEREGIASGSTGRAAGICTTPSPRTSTRKSARSPPPLPRTGRPHGVPYVWLAREGDDANADAIREQVPRMQAHARNVDLVDPAALADRYPKNFGPTTSPSPLLPTKRATWTRGIRRTRGRRTRFRRRRRRPWSDAPVSLGGPTTVDSPTGTESFDAVLVAAGPATKTIVADVGVSLALKAYRVQALVTDPPTRRSPMAYDATQHVYWRPRDGGLFVGDGAHPVDPNDWNRRPTIRSWRARWSAFTRRRRLPRDRPVVGRALYGDTGPDPLLGEVADDLYVATGWHGHGFMRSPAMGERVAAQMLGDGDDSVAHYDPGRFDGDEEFDVIEGMTLEEE